MGAKGIVSVLLSFALLQLSNAQSVECVSSGDCSNQLTDGRVPDCSDCKSYFLCENRALVFGKTCPSILQFNPDTMKCDLQSNVVCATTSLTSPTSVTSVTSVTSMTSESYNCITECNSRLLGLFASCDNCQDYFVCPGGSLGSCPSGELFDSETRGCQPAGSASCLTTSATSPTSATSQTSGTSPTSKTSVTSKTSEISETSRTSLTSESPTTSASSVTSQTSMTTSEAVFCLSQSCGDQPDGYYADCSDCQSYFECRGGQTNRITCSDTLLYNSVLMLCDFDYNVLCTTTSGTSQTSLTSMTSLSSESSGSSGTSGSSPSSGTSLISQTSEAVYCVTNCAGIPDGRYPNCDDCSSAVTCVSEVVTSLFTCSSPLVINPNTMNCDFLSSVTCATTTTSATSPVSLTSETSDQSQLSDQSMTSEAVYCITDCANIPDGRHSSCTNCDVYFDCSAGVGTSQACSTGLQYNSATGFCDLSSNVNCQTTSAQSMTSGSSQTSRTSMTSEPSETSEQSQTSMTSGSSPSSQSSASSVTSGTSQSSQYSPTSEAPYCINSCEGAPDGFWADCTNCAMYHVCGSNSRLVDCGVLRYNPETQRCALQAIVSCATTSLMSETSPTSMSSGTSQTSQTSASSVTSLSSGSSGSSPSSGTSPSSITSLTSEQSEFSETSATSTKPFCLTGCIGVNGVFADCNDCRSYYICTDGNEQNITCGGSLFFNPDTEQCSFTQNCQTTSGTSETSATSPTSASSPTSITSRTSATSEQSETSETSQTSQTSASSPTSLTSASSGSSPTSMESPTSEPILCVVSCTGVPSGFYADCSSCSNYHDCATTFTKKACETGLNWEAENMRCGIDLDLCYVTSVTSITSMTSEESLTSEEGSGDTSE